MWMMMKEIEQDVITLEQNKEEIFSSLIKEGWEISIQFGISTIVFAKKDKRVIRLAFCYKIRERILELSMRDNGFENIGQSFRDIVEENGEWEIVEGYRHEKVHVDLLRAILEWLEEKKVDCLVRMKAIGCLVQNQPAFGDGDECYVALGKDAKHIAALMNQFPLRWAMHDGYFIVENMQPYARMMTMITGQFYPTPHVEMVVINADFYRDQTLFEYFVMEKLKAAEEVVSFKEKMKALEEENERDVLHLMNEMNQLVKNRMCYRDGSLENQKDRDDEYFIKRTLDFTEEKYLVSTTLREETVSTKEEARAIALVDFKRMYRFQTMMGYIRKELIRLGLEEKEWELNGNRMYLHVGFSNSQQIKISIDLRYREGQFVYETILLFNHEDSRDEKYLSLDVLLTNILKEIRTHYRTHRLTSLFQEKA